jgi:hypothetical protein
MIGHRRCSPHSRFELWRGETGDHPRTAKLHHHPSPYMAFAQNQAILNLRRMVVESRGGSVPAVPATERPGERPSPNPAHSTPARSSTRTEGGPPGAAVRHSSPRRHGLLSDLRGISRASGVKSQFDHGRQATSRRHMFVIMASVSRGRSNAMITMPLRGRSHTDTGLARGVWSLSSG